MYKYILQSIQHINWLAVAAMLVFIAVFVYSTWWALSSSKEYVEDMSRLPLEADDPTPASRPAQPA